MAKKPSEQYSDKESRERFEAALRGARVTGPKPKPSPKLKKPASKKAKPSK